MKFDVEAPQAANQILGIPLHGPSLDEALEFSLRRIRERRPTLVSTLNAHAAVEAGRLPEFMAHFHGADLVLPDGILPYWAAAVLGTPLQARISGSDYSRALLRACERDGLSVAFVGTTDATLAELRRRALAQWPKLKIAFTLAPPFGQWSEATDTALVAAINEAGADVLFVGMTAPKQELWLSKNHARLLPPLRVGVGAYFDILAGKRRPAPPFIGKIGLEWLYRLVQEPRRLWLRNLDSAVFLARFAARYGCERMLHRDKRRDASS